MMKSSRARYTLQFKQEAAMLVEGGQSIAAAARTLGGLSRRWLDLDLTRFHGHFELLH